mmetsp:Transcript_34894/g.88666  ORF Transcript_34894/g.88666 Transcript_34894/m.88666 type:complete len:524 (+) Transcript_34894:1947-3518(+)
MDFDEVANYGPSWAKGIRDLILADEPAKAMEKGKEAFVSCVKSGDAKGKTFALHALAKVHLSKCELMDTNEVAERALAELVKHPDEKLSGAVMHTVAKANRDLCRFEDALELAQEAVRIFQGAGSKVGEAAVLNTIARIHLKKGKRQDAIKVAKQSLAMFRDCEEKDGEAEALHTMAKANVALKKYDEALRSANQMVGIYEGSPDIDRHGQALLIVADIRAAQEEHEEAVEAATKAVELFDMADKRQQANATRRLAEACFTKGDDTDGWMYAKEALELYRGEGHVKGEATMLCEIAGAHFASGTFQEGVLIAEEGAKLCREAGLRQLLANTLLASARGRLDQQATGVQQEQQLNFKARQAAKEALGIYQDIGDLYGQMRSNNTLALAFMGYGNVLEGRAKAKRAVELAQTLGDKSAEGSNLLLVAQSRYHDNRDEAVRLANIAQRLLRDNGEKKLLKEAEQVIEQIREEPEVPGGKKKKKKEVEAGASIAETQARKADLMMDLDFMKSKAVYFWGFTSRSTRG